MVLVGFLGILCRIMGVRGSSLCLLYYLNICIMRGLPHTSLVT